MNDTRTVTIPPGEPQATIDQWEAAWAHVLANAPHGEDATTETWGRLTTLYNRLRRYGVPFRPDFAAWFERASAAAANAGDDPDVADVDTLEVCQTDIYPEQL